MTKSTSLNYYEADNVYGVLPLQSPEILIYNEQYKHLNSDTKLAYMVLKDRLEYSLRNNWADEKGYVYFVFTVKELQDSSNCATEKTVKIGEELQTANLLKQIQIGFNPKTKKNESNHLYLSKLGVKATDVYLGGEHEQKEPEILAMSGISRIESPYDLVETLVMDGTSKIRSPHDSVDGNPQTLATSGISKIGSNLYKDYKDNTDTNRYDINTQELDFSIANFLPVGIEAQGRDLVRYVDEFSADEDNGLSVFLESGVVQLFSFWCHTS